jgi:cell wall-associated NlpC family hydrolase
VQRGQLVTVTPVLPGEQLRAGDVVFCRMHGTGLLRIKEVKVSEGGHALWLVGDNTHDYGWAGFMVVHGRLVCVED